MRLPVSPSTQKCRPLTDSVSFHCHYGIALPRQWADRDSNPETESMVVAFDSGTDYHPCAIPFCHQPKVSAFHRPVRYIPVTNISADLYPGLMAGRDSLQVCCRNPRARSPRAIFEELAESPALEWPYSERRPWTMTTTLTVPTTLDP
jgi:hypothetical protein